VLTTPTIHASDAAAMLQLVNELHALPPDPLTRKHHLLQGLCKLLGARVGMIVYLADASGPAWKFQPRAVIDHGWQCAAEREALLAYRDDVARDPAKYADPMADMLKLPGRVITRRREELHADSAWYAGSYVNEHRRAARVDDCLYTLYRLPDRGAIVGLGMHRAWGDRTRFGQRESDLLQILNEQLEFLWRCDVAGETGGLAPRLRQTLGLLMAGHSEKEIARRLGVSRNTVHKYVTALYRHFGVASRPELMARQLGQDGGSRNDASEADACNKDSVN
jgi:DNA-binding CsgD family transcriptional regulator